MVCVVRTDGVEAIGRAKLGNAILSGAKKLQYIFLLKVPKER